MPSKGLGLAPRLRYLVERARRIDVGSVIERAKEASAQHGKAVPVVVVGHALVGGAPQRRIPGLHRLRLRDPQPRRARDLHDAPRVEPDLAAYATRTTATSSTTRSSSTGSSTSTSTASGWSSRRATPTSVRAFAERHGTDRHEEPMGQAGTGVHRYHAADVDDWDAFHRGLLARGELLVEEVIRAARRSRGGLPRHREHDPHHGVLRRRADPHPGDGAEVRARRGRATRCRSAASTRCSTSDGHAVGPGYDSHGHVHEMHPDSGFVIADFQLPMMDEVRAFVDQVARVVPQVQYVGWDVVVTAERPRARRGQLGRGRLREQAERHRHPHRPQAPLPRGHRVLRPAQTGRTMPSGSTGGPGRAGCRSRIATSRFSPALSSVEPRMLPPRSLMSTTATSAVPPSSAFRWRGDLARPVGPEHDGLVVGRDRAARRAVDRARLVAGDAVEVALAAEELRDGRHGGGEQDAGRAALAERHLHRLGHAEADAVRRAGDVLGEEQRELARLDLIEQVRPALRDRDDLLRHEEDVAGLHEGSTVLGDDLVEVVAGHHDAGAEGDARVRAPSTSASSCFPGSPRAPMPSSCSRGPRNHSR